MNAGKLIGTAVAAFLALTVVLVILGYGSAGARTKKPYIGTSVTLQTSDGTVVLSGCAPSGTSGTCSSAAFNLDYASSPFVGGTTGNFAWNSQDTEAFGTVQYSPPGKSGVFTETYTLMGSFDHVLAGPISACPSNECTVPSWPVPYPSFQLVVGLAGPVCTDPGPDPVTCAGTYVNQVITDKTYTATVAEVGGLPIPRYHPGLNVLNPSQVDQSVKATRCPDIVNSKVTGPGVAKPLGPLTAFIFKQKKLTPSATALSCATATAVLKQGLPGYFALESYFARQCDLKGGCYPPKDQSVTVDGTVYNLLQTAGNPGHFQKNALKLGWRGGGTLIIPSLYTKKQT